MKVIDLKLSKGNLRF